jgi:hypothetical protein
MAPNRFVKEFAECFDRLVRGRLVEFEVIAQIFDGCPKSWIVEPLMRLGVNDEANRQAFTGRDMPKSPPRPSTMSRQPGIPKLDSSRLQ